MGRSGFQPRSIKRIAAKSRSYAITLPFGDVAICGLEKLFTEPSTLTETRCYWK